jgi:hypothetical protein
VSSFFAVLENNASYANPQKFMLNFMQELSTHMQSNDKIMNIRKVRSYKLTALDKKHELNKNLLRRERK